MAISSADFGEGAGDQFRAEVLRQEYPWAVGVMLCPDLQMLALEQGGNDNQILFCSPEICRNVGQSLIEFADKWKRGELPGLKWQEPK